jgi:hypothetical protein
MFATYLTQFPTVGLSTAISDGSDSRASWNGTRTPGEAIWPIA